MRSNRFGPAGKGLAPLAVVGMLATALAGLPSPAAAQDSLAEERPESTRWRSEGGDVALIGDHRIHEGETIGDIVVAGGDLTVEGEIDGDALVIGGNLILEDGGLITGDALVSGGDVIDNGGRVEGEMREVDELSALADMDEVRDEVYQELEREFDAREFDAADAPWSIHRQSWFDDIKEGVAGIISTLAFGIVLAGIGSILVFYGRPYLETVSDTIRGSTLRAGAVGLAAGFLLIPGFIVLVVALALSIIGIPLLLLAIPLYPVAVAAAVMLGLLGAAHSLGERTAEQRTPIDFNYRNSYAYLFTGLGMLLAPLIAAHLIGMTGFLGWLGAMLQFFSWALVWVAATVGLGAVVLSRAGTRRTFVAPPSDPTVASETLFDQEPVSGNPHD